MLSLQPNVLFTTHVGQGTGRGLSPRLWSRMAGESLPPDGAAGAFMIADDFLSFGPTQAVAANVGYYASQAGMYKSYEDAGDSIAQLATESGGVIELATDNTDNDEVSITAAAGAGAFGLVSPTVGSDKLTIFEARFRLGQVADNLANIFIGLTEAGCAASNFIGDDGVLADKDLLGFRVAEGAGSTLTFVQQNQGDGVAIATKIASVGTLAANIWYKAGFVYDPLAPASQKIKVYLNNAENVTKITSTDMAAATFPDKRLVFTAALQSASAAIKTLDLDWWAFYQAI